MPKIVSAISVRPAPTRPASPRISPLHNVKLTSRKRGSWASPVTSSTGSGVLLLVVRRGMTRSSRPTIWESRRMRSNPARSTVSTRRPSRSTAMSSLISITSSMRWLMKLKVQPSSLRRRMMVKRFSTSWEVRGEVGSSKRMMRQPRSRAFAHSICCCWAMLSAFARWPTSMSSSSVSSTLRARRRMPAQSMRFRRPPVVGNWPTNMVSATLSSAISAGSCGTR
jgi:hypothetical protein